MSSHRIAHRSGSARRPSTPRRRGPAAAVLLAAAGLALGLVGCDRESDAHKTVRDSATQLEATSVSGRGPAAPEQYRKALNEVNTSAATATDASNKGTKAAAHVLVSQSQQQLAEGPAGEAVTADLAARNLITELTGLFARWSSHIGAAQAAAAFDPSAQIDQIAASKAARRKEQTDLEAQLSQVRSQVEALRSQAQAKMAQADEAQNRYSGELQRAVQMSAREAAPIVERANEDRRISDRLRLEGGKLEAEAESIAPRLTELELRIRQKRSQLADLESIEQSLATRRASAQREASEARSQADQAANDIDNLVVRLSEAYGENGAGGTVVGAYETAISAFEKAARAAREASTAGGRFASAKLAEATSMQSVGDLRWQVGQSLRNYATALQTLAQTSPEIPNASDYAKRATDAQNRGNEFLRAAGEAYESAVSAFGATGGGGDAERIQRLTESLGRLAAELKGEEYADDTAAAAPTQDPAAPAAADAAGGEEPQVRSALSAHLEAMKAGNADAILNTMAVSDPAQRDQVRPLLELAAASTRLEQAMQARFNKGPGDIAQAQGGGMGGMGGMASSLDLDAMSSITANDFAITVNGDQATATAASVGQTLTLVRQDGNWAVQLPPELAAVQAQLAGAGPMVNAITKVMDQIAKEVAEGKFDSAEAAFQAMTTRMMSNMTPPGGG